MHVVAEHSWVLGKPDVIVGLDGDWWAAFTLLEVFGSKAVVISSSLKMLVEADYEVFGAIVAECHFLFHLVNKHSRTASIDDLVLLSTHVPSPSRLNEGASLMLTHIISYFSIPISDHPFFTLFMLSVRTYHHGLGLINIYNLWFFGADVINWLDVDWFVYFFIN